MAGSKAAASVIATRRCNFISGSSSELDPGRDCKPHSRSGWGLFANRAGVRNVSLLLGDGTVGWREYAPYDAILVAAGAPAVPQPLVDQLANGGRLLVPVGDREEQRLVLVQRLGDRIETSDVAPVRFVPLVGTHGWNRADVGGTGGSTGNGGDRGRGG